MAAFASSYIKTEASQVTRSADAASMTGTNFSSWYSVGAGSFFGEYSAYILSGSQTVLETRSVTENRGILMQFSAAGLARNRSVLTGVGGTQALGAINPAVAGAIYKQAVAWDNNDFANVLNGGTVSTSTVALGPGNAGNLFIGTQINAVNPIRGHIRKIAYYPLRVTNAQLQALTS
jgi:hypothetical protein